MVDIKTGYVNANIGQRKNTMESDKDKTSEQNVQIIDLDGQEDRPEVDLRKESRNRDTARTTNLDTARASVISEDPLQDCLHQQLKALGEATLRENEKLETKKQQMDEANKKYLEEDMERQRVWLIKQMEAKEMEIKLQQERQILERRLQEVENLEEKLQERQSRVQKGEVEVEMEKKHQQETKDKLEKDRKAITKREKKAAERESKNKIKWDKTIKKRADETAVLLQKIMKKKGFGGDQQEEEVNVREIRKILRGMMIGLQTYVTQLVDTIEDVKKEIQELRESESENEESGNRSERTKSRDAQTTESVSDSVATSDEEESSEEEDEQDKRKGDGRRNNQRIKKMSDSEINKISTTETYELAAQKFLTFVVDTGAMRNVIGRPYMETILKNFTNGMYRFKGKAVTRPEIIEVPAVNVCYGNDGKESLTSAIDLPFQVSSTDLRHIRFLITQANCPPLMGAQEVKRHGLILRGDLPASNNCILNSAGVVYTSRYKKQAFYLKAVENISTLNE